MAAPSTDQPDLYPEHSPPNKVVNAVCTEAVTDAREFNVAIHATNISPSPTSQSTAATAGAADQSTAMFPPPSNSSVVRDTDHLAAHAILFTNELLCDIVVRLPLHDIVAATGVCRQWKQALAADHSIQRALFLRPERISEVLATERWVNILKNPIPLARCKMIGTLHPILDRICGYALPSGELKQKRAFCLQPFDHPEGTWRNMYATQPPAHTVSLAMRTRVRKDFGMPVREILEDSDGVKIGQVYDLIECRRKNEHYLDPLKVDCEGVYILDYATYRGARSLRPSCRRHIRCSVVNGEAQRPASSLNGNIEVPRQARPSGRPGSSGPSSTSDTVPGTDGAGNDRGE